MRAWILIALVGAVWLPGVAGAEVRKVESVGFVAMDPENPPSSPPRDTAMRRAVVDAVRRVAADEMGGLSPEKEAAFEEALGQDPMQFATRFRVVEDRGVQPALLSADPAVETEYVVVVSVQVDVGRLRQHLSEHGLLTGDAAPAPGGQRVWLALEGLQSHAAYAAVRDVLLQDVRVRSATPILMERGRAVLEVAWGRSPESLVSALEARSPGNLQVVPLGVHGSQASVRVRYSAPPASADPGAAHEAGARPNLD
jgi:hypothetical protein